MYFHFASSWRRSIQSAGTKQFIPCNLFLSFLLLLCYKVGHLAFCKHFVIYLLFINFSLQIGNICRTMASHLRRRIHHHLGDFHVVRPQRRFARQHRCRRHVAHGQSGLQETCPRNCPQFPRVHVIYILSNKEHVSSIQYYK